MTGQPQILNLFPLTIYKNDLDSKQYQDLFNGKLNSFDFTSSDDVLTGEILGKSSIHHIEEFKPFYEEVALNAREYLKILGVKENLFDVFVTKSWLSIIDKPDYHMRAHSHTVADISFVYYLQVPENADSIMFLNNSKQNELFHDLFEDMRERNFLSEYTVSNYNSFFVVPNEGMLLMFPGKQSHKTSANPSGELQQGKRIAVVGDINLYLKPGITGYESGRVSTDYMRKF